MNKLRARHQTCQYYTPRILNQSPWPCLRNYKKFRVEYIVKIREDLPTKLKFSKILSLLLIHPSDSVFQKEPDQKIFRTTPIKECFASWRNYKKFRNNNQLHFVKFLGFIYSFPSFFFVKRGFSNG